MRPPLFLLFTFFHLLRGCRVCLLNISLHDCIFSPLARFDARVAIFLIGVTVGRALRARAGRYASTFAAASCMSPCRAWHLVGQSKPCTHAYVFTHGTCTFTHAWLGFVLRHRTTRSSLAISLADQGVAWSSGHPGRRRPKGR